MTLTIWGWLSHIIPHPLHHWWGNYTKKLQLEIERERERKRYLPVPSSSMGGEGDRVWKNSEEFVRTKTNKKYVNKNKKEESRLTTLIIIITDDDGVILSPLSVHGLGVNSVEFACLLWPTLSLSHCPRVRFNIVSLPCPHGDTSPLSTGTIRSLWLCPNSSFPASVDKTPRTSRKWRLTGNWD